MLEDLESETVCLLHKNINLSQNQNSNTQIESLFSCFSFRYLFAQKFTYLCIFSFLLCSCGICISLRYYSPSPIVKMSISPPPSHCNTNDRSQKMYTKYLEFKSFFGITPSLLLRV